MPTSAGGSAQDRRRARRAEMRRRGINRADLTAADIAEIDALVADARLPVGAARFVGRTDLEDAVAGEEPLPIAEAPETAALALLDAALADDAETTVGEATASASFRIVLDDDAIAEAGELLASRARIVTDDGDVAAPDQDIAAAFERGFAERFRGQLVGFEMLAPAEAPVVEPPADAPPPRGPAQWTAIFVPEGTLTDDGRAFAPDAVAWRDLPLTLMGLNETSAEGGHDGAVACGRIERIWRDGLLIRAGGVFSEDEVGSYYATNVGDGTIRGLSVDVAILDYEVGPRSDYFDEDGNWRRLEAEAEQEETVADVLFDGGVTESPILVVTSAVIGMATVCPFPAFAGASISLAASGALWTYRAQAGFIVIAGDELPETLVAAADAPEAPAPQTPCANCDHAYADHGMDGCEVEGCSCLEYAEAEAEAESESESLTAAAAGLAPVAPPLAWFQDPELEELTPLTVTEDGRIFGHAWAWGSCHTGLPGCTTAPRSITNYAYFRTGEIECDDGSRVAVGRITFDTGHAGQRLSKNAAVAHYDDTGMIGAYVVVGEDEHGGWVAGTLAADITADQAQTMRGAVPSGDWRTIDGNLELIGLLAVNVPGFPVPRPRALVAAAEDGMQVMSLTAAGVAEMLGERTEEDDFREIEALAAEARGDFAALVEQAREAA